MHFSSNTTHSNEVRYNRSMSTKRNEWCNNHPMTNCGNTSKVFTKKNNIIHLYNTRVTLLNSQKNGPRFSCIHIVDKVVFIFTSCYFIFQYIHLTGDMEYLVWSVLFKRKGLHCFTFEWAAGLNMLPVSTTECRIIINCYVRYFSKYWSHSQDIVK